MPPEHIKDLVPDGSDIAEGETVVVTLSPIGENAGPPADVEATVVANRTTPEGARVVEYTVAGDGG